MKLYLPQIDYIAEFKEASFCSAIIEHPDVLREILCDISAQIEGEKKDITLGT